MSLRRRARKTRKTNTSRIGNSRIAIAAPRPSAPDWTPTRNAYEDRTWVELAGPPRVSRYTTVMSVRVKTRSYRLPTNRTGAIIGTITLRKRVIGPAPSTLAASTISCETEVKPASKITAPNGKPRHTLTAMIEMIASVGSPNQFGMSNGLTSPTACKNQLTMLYWLSNIHFQVIELRAIGTVPGSKITKRKKRVPGRFSASRKASVVPSRPFRMAEMNVNISVLRSAVRKTDDSNSATKLSKPTKRPSPEVATSALLTLRYSASRKG